VQSCRVYGASTPSGSVHNLQLTGGTRSARRCSCGHRPRAFVAI